ncbi:hypothetical protein BD311DRAFT_821311 [Dichomitus squalens]|uniref:F-box domain-containing protein n=1 Tax=Dichomitus squalens TaxID=114155 RepID=A0A4V2JZ25_9APHY|nr:hypothetical protein BD311DRAFT_821311 [Dichomitus squalens]
MSDSPRLPWEVIERIISSSSEDRETLHSFSLTCKQLRPRSLCLMFANVVFRFEEGADILAFRDFLDVSPPLRPLVRSIGTNHHAHLAFHLLRLLPNLTQMSITGDSVDSSRRLAWSLSQPVLACYRALGTRIETLHLVRLSFPNLQEFCRMLLAFTSIKTLSCQWLKLHSTSCTSTQRAQIKQSLSQQLHLSMLEVKAVLHFLMCS